MDMGGVMAAPPFPYRYSGPCIIAGSANCLFDDLRRARLLYGESVPVVAINGAAREVRAFILASQHPERMLAPGFEWARHQKRKFGPGFTIHAPGEPQTDIAHVDYWWPVKRAGGSAWFGRKVAGLIGFSPVVLCGCPIISGPYVGNHNIGGFMHRDDVVAELRKGIEADVEWHEGVFSMSGFTRDLLGEGPE